MEVREKRSLCRMAVQRKKYTCCHCKSYFLSIYSMKKHVSKFHSQTLPATSTSGAKCPICNVRSTKVRMYDHFARDHQIKLVYETKVFNNFQQFLCWKAMFEKEMVSKFVCYATHLQGDGSWKRTYNCQRTGSANVKPRSNRVYKVREAGSNKINGFCPARITLHVRADGSAEAVVCKSHVGHTNELGRLTLSKEERIWLASRIAEGISFSDILDEIRDTIEPTKLERIHLTTRKDLHNIAKQFNLTENDAMKRIDGDLDPSAYDGSATTSQEFNDGEDVEPHICYSGDESDPFPQQSSPRKSQFQLDSYKDNSKVKFSEEPVDHADSASVLFLDQTELLPGTHSDDSELSTIFQEDNIIYVVVDDENCSLGNPD